MTSILHNVGALNAQNGITDSRSDLNTAMNRLSTGLRINSAADDAAGSAIASKMESQTRSLTVAIRNTNDAISLTQTAEGALGEIENMLQRMRELTVQAGNSTLNASDRAQIQAEVDQLSAEIDSIAAKTNFNNVKLLDGTNTSVSFQTGIDSDGSVAVSLQQADAAALGLSGSIGGVSRLTSERIENTDMQTLVAAGVKINGQNALSAAAADYSAAVAATELETLINNNTSVHGAVATAFNTVTSAAKGDDFTMSATFTINGETIEIVSSIEELVAEINLEATGVSAVLNGDGTFTLFNDDGDDIAISTSQGATDVGLRSNHTYTGMIALENIDGSDVSIEVGNIENGYVGDAGTDAMLEFMGFNETRSGVISGNTVTDADLADTDGVKINGVAIASTSTSSAAAKVAAINASTDQHGVVATARTELALNLDFNGITASDNDDVKINGVTVDLSAALDTAAVVTAINDQAALAGSVTASTNSEGFLLLSNDTGATIRFEEAGDEDAFVVGGFDLSGAAVAESTSVWTARGSITLTSESGGFIKLEDSLNAGTGLAKLGLQGSSIAEEVSGTGVNVATSANATAALSAVDAAIEKVGTFRASFGAYENRFDSAISNLTTYKSNLEAAQGRITDADFAAETSNLTKAQILQQAATSMLAQANASKQGLLALLQG
ncbi:MAG: flagellin [Parvibaculales bacterium]